MILSISIIIKKDFASYLMGLSLNIERSLLFIRKLDKRDREETWRPSERSTEIAESYTHICVRETAIYTVLFGVHEHDSAESLFRNDAFLLACPSGTSAP